MMHAPRTTVPGTVAAALCAALVAGCGARSAAVRGATGQTAAGSPSPAPVRMDMSSAEELLLRPERVLEDVRGFWERDRAYWLVAKHGQEAGFAMPPAGWEDAVRRLASVPAERREADGRYLLARQLASAQDLFNQRAVPHIQSFFAPGSVDLSTTVYGTVATWQNAFQKDYRIVVNISHPEWRRDQNTILNTLVHELYHVGFYRAEALLSEVQLDDSERYDVLLNLLNEGMATWVAYTARDIFPSRVADYGMLEDSAAVRGAIRSLNALLSLEEAAPADSFRQRMWVVGVQERALYIAGGHMARTIERSGGRNALVAVFSSGPRSFVAAYNRLVGQDERIVEYAAPTALSPYQEMRRAAVAGDYRAMRRAIAAIRARGTSGGPPVGHALQTTGQLLLGRREPDPAVEVFTLFRELFPRHANPLEGLARAHLMRGDTARATAALREILTISPSNVFAVETLAELGVAPADG